MGATSPENTGELRFFNATKLSNSGLTLADFQGYRQVKISTVPMNLGGDPWSDAET